MTLYTCPTAILAAGYDRTEIPISPVQTERMSAPLYTEAEVEMKVHLAVARSMLESSIPTRELARILSEVLGPRNGRLIP